MKRLLLIVDPQIDFITGSLPVPNAESAMDKLAEYVALHASDYHCICVTCDRHPLCHCSFHAFGGQWPPHCIESSVGAAVWNPLMLSLEKYSDRVRFLYKGQDVDKDEYSIFQNRKGADEMHSFINDLKISDIDICGLAGDVCVANTLQDARRLYPHIRFHILSQYTASLDGGTILSSLTATFS